MPEDFEHATRILDSPNLAAGGPSWQEASALLRDRCDARWIRLTSSGTTALEAGAMALGLGSGSEVAVPAFAFVTTASAFARAGARLVFADIDPTTLTVDPNHLEAQMTPRTHAFVAVHYGGVACDIDALVALQDTSNAVLIEDNAHGLGGSYDGRPLGSFGLFSTLSFGWTKNISCGEGGAILSNDEAFSRTVDAICDRGTNRRAFLNGEVDRYEWTLLGINADLSELAAAYLLGQLSRLARITARRREIWSAHDEALGDWADSSAVSRPHVPGNCEPAHHIYYLLMPDPKIRPRFIQHLLAHGVEAAFHYSPLHLSPVGQEFGGAPGSCPVAESVSARIVRIPCHHTLSRGDLDRIHTAVTSFDV
jgi:dTDP-4-amino-4,6-dideoxygalactose transaminase